MSVLNGNLDLCKSKRGDASSLLWLRLWLVVARGASHRPRLRLPPPPLRHPRTSPPSILELIVNAVPFDKLQQGR